MGKKEKDIKRQNAEFYKEYNNQDGEKEFMEYVAYVEKEDMAREKLEEVAHEEERVCNSVVRSLNDYSNEQGLDLNVSADNMLNYIRFFGQCEKKEPVIRREPPPQPPQPVPRPTVSYDATKDPEIQRLVHTIIIKSGEDQILDDYLAEFHEGEVPPGMTRDTVFAGIRKKLLKMYGNADYYSVVEIAGRNNYNKAKYRLGI